MYLHILKIGFLFSNYHTEKLKLLDKKLDEIIEFVEFTVIQSNVFKRIQAAMFSNLDYSHFIKLKIPAAFGKYIQQIRVKSILLLYYDLI